MSYTDSSYSKLGEKIKAARKEAGLTQFALANGIITRNMLSRIENGGAIPSLPTLCALAERLNYSPGFFIEDWNDGSGDRTKRLLEWIDTEYRLGNYETALQYAECLNDTIEQRESLLSRCRYAIAVEKMHDGRLWKAQADFASILKEAPPLSPCEISEGKIYRALLDGFLTHSESGREEETFLSLYRYADIPGDLVTFSIVLNVLRATGIEAAEAVHRFSVYTERRYALLLEAVFYLERHCYADAKKRLLESLGFFLLPPFQAYAMTMLESCAAATNDFENAYAYMERRRRLVAEWTKKN